MKKIWIIILIVILISMVSFFSNILISSIINGGMDMSFIGFCGNVEKTEKNIRKEEKIDMKEIEDLRISFTSADINVILTDTEELKVVQYSNKELRDKELFSINKTNSKVEIAEGNLGVRFSFNLFNCYKVVYDIYIPRDYSENLSMKTVSGDIKISEELKVKNIEVISTSGNIELQSNFKTIEMNIKTVSGDITIEKIESDKLLLETTSGDIKIKSATNSIDAKSISGNIEFKNISGNLKAKTTSRKYRFE